MNGLPRDPTDFSLEIRRLAHLAAGAEQRDARAARRDAARSVVRARNPERSDDAAALADWQALVLGRWSLIDHFDSDGRRFLVARRNDPSAMPIRGLSERETQIAKLAALGHSNKLIAYELGLSLSSVGTHIASAILKLGVGSRVGLIRCLAVKPAEAL